MNNYLADLLKRMGTKDVMVPGFSSSQSVSWQAHREAEKVEDASFIAPLISYIGKEKSKNKRRDAYFLVGNVVKNTGDTTGLNYLIESVAKETDKNIISAILERIAEVPKPVGTNLQPLINATKSTDWQIRHSAIDSLTHADSHAVENTLIELLENTHDKFDLIYTCAVLNTTGTAAALPYLQKQLAHTNKEVREAAQYAMDEIKERK